VDPFGRLLPDPGHQLWARVTRPPGP
jgi:hypothetical protein